MLILPYVVIFAEVLFYLILFIIESQTSRKFPLQLMSIYNNENITVMISVRENYGVYKYSIRAASKVKQAHFRTKLLK